MQRSQAFTAELDTIQAHLGALVTAYGQALRHAEGSEHVTLSTARAWALEERARILEALGRPAEARRIRARRPALTAVVAA